MNRLLAASVLLGFVFSGTLAAQGNGLKPEVLKSLKSATVFVKVGAKGYNFSGSGFVVQAGKDYGYIVTNQHVVEPQLEEGSIVFGGFGMVRGLTFNVDVVFDSGTPTEWTTRAEIIHTDPIVDLALLKVKAVRPLPKPLELKGADRLPETAPVYVCGFPFGGALATSKRNPEHSIGIGSVASNRVDDAGELAAVQINGALNPGNSGGPVVSADGKLVGVAVSSVLGAGIGFAIPPVKVRTVVEDIHVGLPKLAFAPGDPAALRFTIPFADPSDRLRTLTAHVAPAPDRRSAGRVADMDGAIELKLVYHAEDQTYRVEIPQPKGTHLWYQASIEPKTGRKKTTAPLRIAVRASTGGTTEISPTWRDPGYYGLKSSEGLPLPHVATLLGPTPEGNIDAEILNRTADANVGKTFTTDVLQVAIIVGGIPEGHELRACDGDGLFLGSLKFNIDDNIRSRLRESGVTDCRLAFRLTGSVQLMRDSDQKQFVVEQVGLIGLDGKTLTTFKRTKAFSKLVPPQPGLRYPVEEKVVRDFEASFRKDVPTSLSRSYEHALIISDIQEETIQENGKSQTLKKLIVRNLLGEVWDGVRLLAKPELADKIAVLLAKHGKDGVPGRMIFRKVCLDRKTIVCAVSEFNVHDGHTAGERFKAEAPDFKQVGIVEPDRYQLSTIKQDRFNQNSSYRNLLKSPKYALGRIIRWKVVVKAIEPASVDGGGRPLSVSRWTVIDLDDRPIDLHLYSSPALAARVLEKMKESQRFHAAIQFKVMRLNDANALECGIDQIEELDEFGRKLIWIDGDDHPDIPIQTIDHAAKAVKPPPVETPQGGPSEPSSNITYWVLVCVVSALLCSIGIAIAALLRKGSGGSKTARRSGRGERPGRRSERRRDQDADDDDDEDRPRRRRRRD